jgi:EAL domain-containing protein (putative c-di-GMP-specific phosphodiesterase class I)
MLASQAPLVPTFQPVMELATGRVAGYEALARFAAPFERPPQLWFAQAHRCGLGAVLEARALEVAPAVAERPAGTFLALNVSPAALLSAEVGAALPDDLDGIVIELTEHEAFDEDGALELALTALRARGARIALDDAGAGYAGLQQLIRIRPDIVKVDRSLVAGIHDDPSNSHCSRRSRTSRRPQAPRCAQRASRSSPSCARSPASTSRTPRVTRWPGRTRRGRGSRPPWPRRPPPPIITACASPACRSRVRPLRSPR